MWLLSVQFIWNMRNVWQPFLNSMLGDSIWTWMHPPAYYSNQRNSAYNRGVVPNSFLGMPLIHCCIFSHHLNFSLWNQSKDLTVNLSWLHDTNLQEADISCVILRSACRECIKLLLAYSIEKYRPVFPLLINRFILFYYYFFLNFGLWLTAQGGLLCMY